MTAILATPTGPAKPIFSADQLRIGAVLGGVLLALFCLSHHLYVPVFGIAVVLALILGFRWAVNRFDNRKEVHWNQRKINDNDEKGNQR
ncbi:MAG: hypothetical protein JWR78_1476 [Mycobacterium sp.]|nr:hypothetical protein [Mycobacterium sp.]